MKRTPCNPSEFNRVFQLEIELSTCHIDSPLGKPGEPAPRHIGTLIRLHGRPLGYIVIDIGDSLTSSNWDTRSSLVQKILTSALTHVSDEINAHLVSDGISPVMTTAELANIKREPILCSEQRAETERGEISTPVTVAIPTYNNWDSCKQTISRVLQGSKQDFEILVIDNATQPHIGRTFFENNFSDPRVRYVHQPRPGSSAARNAAIDNSAFDIVAYLDDDVIVDTHWLQSIIAPFHDDDVSCVTGSIFATEIETPAQAWLEEYGGYLKGFQIKRYDLKENKPDSPLYPYDAGRFGSGANAAFRKKVLNSVNGFNEALGAGVPACSGEDIDIFSRLIRSGYQLVYEPKAVVWHAHRRSTSAVRKQMFRYGIGLSAMVTSWFLSNPKEALSIIKRVPIGIKYMFDPTSDKNCKKTTSFPNSLSRLEKIGLFLGPFAYLKSLLQSKRSDQ